MFSSDFKDIAEEAEKLLASLVPSAICVPQEWDGRIDLLITLEDGSVIGEVIRAEEVTETRIRETAERFEKRLSGVNVPLVNELRAPVRIRRPEGDYR